MKIPQRTLFGITGSPGTDKTCLCSMFAARGIHPVRGESACSGWRSLTSPRRSEFDAVLRSAEIAPEDVLATDGHYRHSFYDRALQNPALFRALTALDIPGVRSVAQGWQEGSGQKGTVLIWRHLSEIWNDLPLAHVFLFHFGDRARFYERIRSRAHSMRVQTSLTDHVLDAFFHELGLDYESMLESVRARMGENYTLVDTSDREAAAQTVERTLARLLPT